MSKAKDKILAGAAAGLDVPQVTRVLEAKK